MKSITSKITVLKKYFLTDFFKRYVCIIHQVQTPLFFREFLKKCKNVCSETIIFHNNSSICSISVLYLAEDLTFL